MYAASALAANTIARSACGAAAPLFTNQMFDAMGVGGGGSLIGGLAALLGVVPFVFYRYGKGIRMKSKFAPTKLKAEARVADEERQASEERSSRDDVPSDETVSGSPEMTESKEEGEQQQQQH